MDWPISWNDVKEALDNAGGGPDIIIRTDLDTSNTDVNNYTLDWDINRVVSKMDTGDILSIVFVRDYIYGGTHYVKMYHAGRSQSRIMRLHSLVLVT